MDIPPRLCVPTVRLLPALQAERVVVMREAQYLAQTDQRLIGGGSGTALQRELGLAYLFITPNIGVVEYIADRVAVMQGGRIVEQGASEAVLQHPQHEYTRTLLAAAA